MSSKYDTFWQRRLLELRNAVERAADGSHDELVISEIRSLGERASWHGTAVIQGTSVLSSSMAHMRSLANGIVNAALCTAWPETTFRFFMRPDGRVLTVTAQPGRGTPRESAVSEAARTSVPRTLEPLIGTATHQSDLEIPVDPTVACGEIHTLLQELPRQSAPSEVSFSDGLYFFYEKGESSAHAPGGRIVRIGNHPRAQHRLVGRLGDHYRSQDGAKNGSVFRRYIGGALLRRLDAASPCLAPSPGEGHWERQDERACPACSTTESAISAVLATAFWFRCVRVDDQDERNQLEARLIATVAACTVCQPSRTWLGLHAYPPLVQSSGLWNTQHVGGPVATRTDLDRFAALVRDTQPGREIKTDRLDKTLLLIPCSGSKTGAEDPGLKPIHLTELLSPTVAGLLEEGVGGNAVCTGSGGAGCGWPGRLVTVGAPG